MKGRKYSDSPRFICLSARDPGTTPAMRGPSTIPLLMVTTVTIGDSERGAFCQLYRLGHAAWQPLWVKAPIGLHGLKLGGQALHLFSTTHPHLLRRGRLTNNAERLSKHVFFEQGKRLGRMGTLFKKEAPNHKVSLINDTIYMYNIFSCTLGPIVMPAKSHRTLQFEGSNIPPPSLRSR
jgi:hypothetical protein